MPPFLTIEFIETQIIKPCRSINDFFNLPCMQMKLQNQLNLGAIVTVKLLTKFSSQQFVLKVLKVFEPIITPIITTDY